MKVLNKWIIGILVVIIGFVFYSNIRKEVGYQKMKPAEVKTVLEKDESAVLLDVRTMEEYREKHIEGSTLIPLDILEKEVVKIIPDKNQKVIVYCRSGNRSKTAANILLRMGYRQVYDLGGINSWPYDIIQ